MTFYRHPGQFTGSRSRAIHIPRARAPKKQRGMTLIVGLILLVMLMSVSMIGFRNTTLSERMTGNLFDRNISFQSAESAGKEALQAIEGGTFSVGNVGHYGAPFANGDNTEFWTQGAGASVTTPLTNCPAITTFSWTSCAALVASAYANTNTNTPQYVIELVSTFVDTTTTTYTYRVTSRSTGGTGSAESVLQVIYMKTINNP